MTILVLDSRWPDMIPLAAATSLAGPITYTDEVPVSVRWNLGDISTTDSAQGTMVNRYHRPGGAEAHRGGGEHP